MWTFGIFFKKFPQPIIITLTNALAIEKKKTTPITCFNRRSTKKVDAKLLLDTKQLNDTHFK